MPDTDADTAVWGFIVVVAGGGAVASPYYCEMLRYFLLSLPAYRCRSLLLRSKIDITVDGTINRHAIVHHPVPFSLCSPLLSLTSCSLLWRAASRPIFLLKPVLDGDGGWWELWCGRREKEGGYLSTGALLLLPLVYLYYSSWGILLLTITPCQIIMYFWMTFGNTLCS